MWEYEAMLWEAGGDILTPTTRRPRSTSRGRAGPDVLQQLQQDGSLYLDFHPDAGKYGELFNSGNIGMMITGPWDLSAFPDVNYGVQVMPSFDAGGSHETIAGPDNWVIFDNGPERVDASWEFLKYLTSPRRDPAGLAGHGPPADARLGGGMPGFKQFDTKYPGVGTFVANLANVKKARPQIPQYPQISRVPGPGGRERAPGQGRAAGRARRGRRAVGRRPGVPQIGDGGVRGSGAPSRPTTRSGWAFAFPAVSLIVLFGIVPIVWSAILSFQQTNLLSPPVWVGLDELRRAPEGSARSGSRWSTPRSTRRCSCRCRSPADCSPRSR